MRPASYYFLAQSWPHRRHQGRPGASFRVTRRGRHAMARRRRHPARELSALAHRALAVFSTSQPA